MEEKNLDIHGLWLIFHRRKWLFILPGAICMALGILIAVGLPRVYESRCVLLVEPSKAIQGIFEEGDKSSKAPFLVKTVQEMMLGWESVIPVLKEAGLLSETDHKQDGYKTEVLYKDVIGMVKVNTKSENLIETSFQDKQPFIAYRVMEGLVSNFMERFLSLARLQVDNTLNFIEKDLKRLREKLDESEEKLREFEEQHFSELPEAEMNNLVKLHTYKDNLSKINLEIAIQKEKLSLIDESLKKEGTTVLGEVIMVPNPKVAEMNKRVDELDNALVAMRTRYYDTHPAISLAKKELEGLKNKLKDEEKKVVGAEKNVNNPIYEQMATKRYDEMLKLRALELQQKETETSIVPLEESVKAIPSVKKELTELRRNYDVLRALYNERLAQKSKEELRREMSMYAMATPFTIIEPPRIPKKPIKATRIKVLIISLFLGLAIGTGLVFATEQLDQGFKSVEETKEFLQIPLLGIVPTIHLAEDVLRERRKKWRIVVIAGAASGAVGVLLTIIILVAPEVIQKGLDTIQRIIG